MLSMNHAPSSDVAKGRASTTPDPSPTLNGSSTARSIDDKSTRIAAAHVRWPAEMWSKLVAIAVTIKT
jgi:hypothetical protein